LRFTIIRGGAVPSTNDAAKALARAGAPAGTVVTADAQTSGRGTKGRAWDSPPGLGLYASIVLQPPAEALALLPLAAGLAARAAVERSAGVEARLRWPNDLEWEGRKLGGILCESGFTGAVLDFSVVGIGINVGQAKDDFPAELRDRAVSLRMAAGRSVDVEAVLGALLPALDEWTARLAAEGGAAIAAAFSAQAVPAIGGGIVLDRGEGPFGARYEGIAPDGALLVSTDSGPRRFLSAEIIRVG
jgi:BirA family biotin operon repressor/biotin-[acetyl-CoA-carboxylase] ligase